MPRPCQDLDSTHPRPLVSLLALEGRPVAQLEQPPSHGDDPPQWLRLRALIRRHVIPHRSQALQGNIIKTLASVVTSEEEAKKKVHSVCTTPFTAFGMLTLLMQRRILRFIGFGSTIMFSHKRTPIDEAVSRGKLDVVDAINAAAAQVELMGTSIS